MAQFAGIFSVAGVDRYTEWNAIFLKKNVYNKCLYLLFSQREIV